MKTGILASVFILMTYVSFGQCVADAGPDKIVCIIGSTVDSVTIGGNPTASFGVPPYTYTWSAYYLFDLISNPYVRSASYYLNDTTIANPTIISFYPEFMDFYLEVRDANNNVCRDTVTIRYSAFHTFPAIRFTEFDIIEGDSVELDFSKRLTSGGVPPLSIVWRPNHGLTDSTSHVVWAKPKQTTYYYAIIVDSGGCSPVPNGAAEHRVNVTPFFVADNPGPVQDIGVSPVSVSELLNNSALSIYPNPTSDFVSIKSENLSEQKFSFSLFNVQGALVYSKEVEVSEKISLEQFPSGMYIYQISQGKETIGQGKLVRE